MADHVFGGLHCTDVEDLAASFVLGALEPDEAAAVRAHLAACPEAHAEMVELGSVVPALFETVEPVAPPPALKGRILAATGSRPRIFLANLGALAAFTARASFVRNFFEAGGIEAITSDGFASRDATDRYRPALGVRALSDGFLDDEWVHEIAAPLMMVGWQIDGNQIRRAAPKALDPVQGLAIVVRDPNAPPPKAVQLKAALTAARLNPVVIADPAMPADGATLWIGRRPGSPPPEPAK